jgi:FtsH-binding integral membrane protein
MPAHAMIKLANRRTGILIVAIAFALSGAVSALISSILISSGPNLPQWIVYFVGVPFAIVSMLFFSASSRQAPVLLVLNSAAWIVAYFTYLYVGYLSLSSSLQYLLWCAPGFVGGVCVALATAIGRRNLFRITKIIVVALIGLVTGMLFFAFNGVDAPPPWRIYADFAVWQSAVGVTLYLLSAR